MQISQSPKIAQKWFCIQNLHMNLSFQEKKKQFENPILGCRDIRKINTAPFFFKHPVPRNTTKHGRSLKIRSPCSATYGPHLESECRWSHLVAQNLEATGGRLWVYLVNTGKRLSNYTDKFYQFQLHTSFTSINHLLVI